MTEPDNDGLDDLYERLYRKRSGWHWIINPETGGFAVIPEAAKSESEWEARSLIMHANQKALKLDAKPQENAMRRIVRGD